MGGEGLRLYFTIAAIRENWAAIAHELSDAVILSGLFDAAEKIFVSLVGSEDRSMFPPDSEKFSLVANPNAEAFEFPALNRLRADSQGDDFYAFYGHTKGITSGAHDHRKYLIGHTIWRWRECVAFLEAGKKASGADFNHREYTSFPANFWWARSGYLRGLCKPQDAPCAGKYHRFKCEAWVGTQLKDEDVGSIDELANKGLNFYHWAIPKRLFTWGR